MAIFLRFLKTSELIMLYCKYDVFFCHNTQIVTEMYELIEEFNVPTPPEDFAVYQTLSPSINNVMNCIDKALADRDANVDKFCSHLDKDITELGKEVKEVKQESQVGVPKTSQSCSRDQSQLKGHPCERPLLLLPLGGPSSFTLR